MPKLLVRHPEKGDSTFALTGERITIGRRAENTIQINHGTISGIHAELIACNGHYILRDLDSTNHCFIDGVQVTEAELTERCKLMIGTVKCEYIPEAPLAALARPASDVDSLRKTIGMLRAQNEELVIKLSEQQSQINILGSARLLTPAAGADLVALRDKVASLTRERDKLRSENEALRAQIERSRIELVESGEHPAMKRTAPVTLPTKVYTLSSGIRMAPDGQTTDAPPAARIAASVSPAILEQAAGLSRKLHALTADATDETATAESTAEMLRVAKELAESARGLGDHPAARLSEGVESLLKDVSARTGAIEPGVIRTVALATETLSEILTPEAQARCQGLPNPSILAIEDDKDLLPAITAALEFSRLPTTGCDDGAKALETLESRHFNLILLDSTLPDAVPSEICTKIHGMPKHTRTPVLFLNGDANAAQHGASDFLSKPFNMYELTVKAHTWALKNQLAIA